MRLNRDDRRGGLNRTQKPTSALVQTQPSQREPVAQTNPSGPSPDLQAHYVHRQFLDPTPTPSLDQLILGKHAPAYWAAKQRFHDSVRKVQEQRVNTQSLEPGVGTGPIRRSQPAYEGEKPTGFVGALRGPDGKTYMPGERAPLGSVPTNVPYYETPIDHRSGMERAVDAQVTPILAQGEKIASPWVQIAASLPANLVGLPAIAKAIETKNETALVGNLALFFPFLGVPRAAAEAVRALKAGNGLGEALRVAKATMARPAAEHILHQGGTNLDAATVEMSFSGATADAVAPKYGLNPRELSDYAAQNSDRLTGRILSNGEVWNEGHTDYDALRTSVTQGLRGADRARREQDVLYSQERSARARAAAQAMQESSGVTGYHAALGELKGELPKLKFGGFENFDQSGLDALLTHIQQHDTLRPFEKIRAQGAIMHVLGGQVPTRSELRLLQDVFGRDVTDRIQASLPFWQKAKTGALEVLNVPRSLMASFDLSAPFRQGIMVGVTHPRLFFKNFEPMIRAFGSENFYRSVMDDIAARPTFPEMQDSGLSLTDLGALDQREEHFMSNLAEQIPVIGHVVRASDRAYTGFLNKTRADLFDFLLDSAHQQGITVDKDLLGSVSRYVNSATGRGDLGAFKGHAVTLNTLFFSPRLLFSRLNFMNPVYYARLDPFARKEALRAARNLVATMGLVLYTAKLAGAKVNDDPRNADFAKIRIGNTRIDLAGGFQQPIRVLAQLFSGKIISSTTGKELTLGPQGPGHLSRRDIAERFFEGKLSPVPSVVNDWFKGTDFQGNSFSWKKEALQHMLPLLAQDAYDLNNSGGPVSAIGGYTLGAFGVGLQTYGPKPAQFKDKQSHFLERVKAAGMPTPPQHVMDELKIKTQLDHEIHMNAEHDDGTLDYGKAAVIAARAYDQKHPGANLEARAANLRTIGEAMNLYSRIRANLYPLYSHWQSVADNRIDRNLERQPVKHD